MERQQKIGVGAERLLFLDNLKWLLALVVVVFHSACAYSSASPWWYVAEPDSFSSFDIFLLFVDITAMPLFFFIAGYLTQPSLERYGSLRFLLRKVRRLVLPWAVGVSTAGPIVMYLGYYYRMGNLGYQPLPFFPFWKMYMADGLRLYTGSLPSIDQFSLHHFWFISLLFAFFLVLVLVHPVLPVYESQVERNDNRPPPSTVKPSVVVVAVTVVGFTLLNLRFHDVTNLDFSWVIVGSFLQFQPTRLLIYGCYFIFGLYAFHRRWFVAVPVIKRLWLWGIALFGLFFALLLVVDTLIKGGERGLPLVVLFGVLRTLVCFVGVLFFLGVGKRYFDSAHPLQRRLLGHSYNIYLWHYVVVVVFQYLLLVHSDLPIAVKVCLVLCGSLLTTITISSLLQRLTPAVGALSMATGFILLCCFW